MNKNSVKYKKFNDLMAEVEDDLSAYADDSYIEPDKYIKIIQTCNAFLSLKINPIREAVIRVEKGRSILPDDFKKLKGAYICFDYTTVSKSPGTHIEYSSIEVDTEVLEWDRQNCGQDCKCSSCMSCDPNKYTCTPYQIWKKDTYDVVNVKESCPMTILDVCNSVSSKPNVHDYYHNSAVVLNIQKEGGDMILNSNVESGIIVINYIADMVDEEGDLIIFDHPMVTDYYEYAIKQRIFEDMYLNGYEDVLQRLQYMEQKLVRAKDAANNFISMFSFKDLARYWAYNRRKFYDKYFKGIM